MTEEEFYHEAYGQLVAVQQRLLSMVEDIRRQRQQQRQRDPIEYCKSRIKTADSMMEKLERKGLTVSKETALTEVYDAVGIRIICTFADDVHLLAELLRQQEGIRIVEEKDYVRYPKASGYRSYHMIVEVELEVGRCYYGEIQIRTIAMDCWAALEHQMNYKQHIANQELVSAELRRCADEIASTDLTLQTIRDIIQMG